MRAVLSQPILPAVAGGIVEVPVAVHNTSDVVDAVTAVVHGLEPHCVTAAPASLALFPDSGGTVTLRLAIPRQLPAGPRSIRVELCSSADPVDREVLDLVLDVAPATEGRLELRPAAVTMRRQRRVEVACTNLGNRPLTVAFTARDRERDVRVAFAPAVVDIEPGMKAISLMHLRVRRRLLGGDRTIALAVEASSRDLELSANATITHRSLLARGFVTALILACVVAAWVVGVLLGMRAVLDDDPVPRLVPASFVGEAGGDRPGGSATGEGAAADKLAAIAGAAVDLPGTVEAASTGEGVGRVLVSAVREGGEPPIRATAATDENGAFALKGLVPGRYQLAFQADGYVPASYPGEVVVGGDDGAGDISMVLRGQPGGVTGIVGFGGPGGVAPAGTVVQVRAESGAQRVTVGAVGPDGTFAIGDLATPATYELTAVAPFFDPVTVDATLAAGETVEVGLVPLTAGPGSIAGLVTDGVQPLGGVQVRAVVGAFAVESTTVTDGDVGTFELTDLPTPGRYIITFSIEGFGTTTTAVELGAAQAVSDLQIVLTGGVGAITGSVVDTDGAPVEGASVKVAGHPPATTDATGAFALGDLRAPGAYTLVVEAGGLTPASVPVTLDATGAAEVAVTLQPAAGRLIGTVTANAPIVGASVRVGEGDDEVEATTGADGTFALDGIPPGETMVIIEAAGFVPRTVVVDIVEGGETVVHITVEAEAPG